MITYSFLSLQLLHGQQLIANALLQHEANQTFTHNHEILTLLSRLNTTLLKFSSMVGWRRPLVHHWPDKFHSIATLTHEAKWLGRVENWGLSNFGHSKLVLKRLWTWQVRTWSAMLCALHCSFCASLDRGCANRITMHENNPTASIDVILCRTPEVHFQQKLNYS